MTRAVAYALALGVSVLAGWAVPALAMRALAPSLEASRLTAVNYRGRTVFLGLGLVWVIWSVALLVTSTGLAALGEVLGGRYGSVEMLLFDGPLTLSLYSVPIILTLAATSFGMVDDVFGTSADKGFRGHLRALFRGRLSTGGLKLLGIGLVAAVYGWSATVTGVNAELLDTAEKRAVGWVLATLVIALSANLLNLMDLRPGRALKTYGILVVPAAAVFALDASGRFAAATPESLWTAGDTAVTLAALLVVLLGPAAAVWRFDLGERGMLGDAGANAMGAIVGYLLAGSLPLAWLSGVAVALFALNIMSERVSFSALIERVAPLRALDRLGRLPAEAAEEPRAGAGSGGAGRDAVGPDR